MNGGAPEWPQGPPAPTAAAPQGSVLAALEWPGDVRDLPRPGAAWPWLLLAVALALVAGSWFRRARAVAPVAPVGPPPASALARLRALALPGPGAPFAAFYRELKAVLRVHAAERFGLVSEVRTSEELRAALPPAGELAAALSACDQVLFAAVVPDAAGHLRAHAAAASWITATGKEPA